MVTERDRRLLSTIHSFGLITTIQLRKLIFAGISDKTALRRIRVLEKAKLIQRHSGLENGTWTWTLTSKGAAVIGEVPTIQAINKNKLVHDVTINDVRIALSSTGLAKGWMSGHKLMHDAGQALKGFSTAGVNVPDSLFSIETSKGRIVLSLEVELVAKTMKRYVEAFRHYWRKKNTPYYLYVVPSEAIGRKVMAAEKETRLSDSSIWMMWAHLDDVLSNPGDFTIHTAKDDLKFSRVAKLPQEKSTIVPAESGAERVSKAGDLVDQTQNGVSLEL